jgi:hypothetical protein
MTDPHSPLDLVRRYEPVLRYTAGEMFFPMPVYDYLAHASLWMTVPYGKPTLLIDHGKLDADSLPEAARDHPDAALFLRYAPASLRRAELKAWRNRPDRPAFTGVSRLAAVGLMGRIIDSGMRLSLIVRGRVPGGLTAASQQQYARIAPPRDAYHAHISSDGGYVVIQYWFLYAMNDWRSSFSGVNDHESDWEQVTIYLAPDAVGNLVPAWIAFSSHDETGDELRRRPDDPDITWVDRTHPVVNAGAGSHSGAYLPGDYLVRVQPPAIARVFSVITSIRSLLLPWTRGNPSLGVGIPYVDYRRGDGVAIGPGTGRPWMAIFIDSNTPWVRDFRGLWGLDTADPFGGERAPAGPRYERSGAIRASWADPVGWAGLDKVPPTPVSLGLAEQARIVELDELIAECDTSIADGQDRLRRIATGLEVLPPTVTDVKRDGLRARMAASEAEVAAVRARRRDAVNERDQLRHIGAVNLHPAPHAHLRHRAVPDTATPAGLVMRFWAGASLSILLILLGLALLLEVGPLVWTAIGAVLIVMAIEALLRRRLAVFLLSVVIVAGGVLLIWLLITNLRVALGVVALVAALTIGVANLRTLARR